MHKKLIAPLLAGLVTSPVALAQSNVGVYGIIDAFFSYAKAGDNKRTGVDSGGAYGSRLGFRGSEDLGDGLKAVFTLEYALSVDQNEGLGTGGLRARQQFVGLQGDLGFVGLGRQYAPGYAIARYDAAGGVPFGPQALLSGGAGASITPASPARWSNAIAYKSPKFGSLTAEAIYSLGERNQDDNRRDGDRWALAGDYSSGPLEVGLKYHHGKEVAIGGGDQKEWGIGASYNFKVAALYATYQTVKTDDTDKVWHVGVRVPTSSGRVYVAYGEHDAEDSRNGARAATLGYIHALSKRTNLYTAYTHVDNESNQNIPNIRPTGVTTMPGDNVNGIVVGMFHLF
ncbi:porin [Aromatoleum aromaticum]|uniref:Outer membrane porin protein, similar to (OMP32) n=1 Tax=Aromatoleum aromaticum (strain DSM 19018 / LMG 30748 / EbN1) TaxID=76114 RepID=Q5P028_AROAE|nr:porin [Aromatoleum aromaticum]NMG54850.1 porin [Aromatoleum aromaticum]CAI09336.1 Outer membrane porin protein, similar to precursor (OMP32) [Aromatoleum aromaticum EbN1]